MTLSRLGFKMTASMTAFARGISQEEWGQATWEIRSVNHRYLDLSFKLPEYFREWEPNWRHLVQQFLCRGKVECHLAFFPSKQTAGDLRVNEGLVEKILAKCQNLMQYSGIASQITVMDLLRWPEVLISEPPNILHLQNPLTQLLSSTIIDLVAARKREGMALKNILERKLEDVLKQVEIVKNQLPLCIETQKQKLVQKLNEIQTTIDPQRLEQELVFYAQKVDIQEEVDRLANHVKEIQRILTQEKGAGRRLDFLMQEMNREANTLGAKTQDAKIAQAAIELKVVIEQMREQIQNVE